MYWGSNANASALADADLGPQERQCFIPANSTIIEMRVSANNGTPNIIIGRNRAGTIANIVSAALATAASGGIACASAAGGTSAFDATSCASTLQNTGLTKGDYLQGVSGTAGGVAKSLAVHIIYQVLGT
jgi:hypothetical protein